MAEVDERKRHKGKEDERRRGERSLFFILALEEFILGRNVEKEKVENGEKNERTQTWIY